MITYPFSALDPKFDISGLLTTSAMIKDKPEAVKAFRAAGKKFLAYAPEHSEHVRQIVTTYTKKDRPGFHAAVLMLLLMSSGNCGRLLV